MRKGIVFAFISLITIAAPEAWADGDQARQHFEAGKKLRDEDDCVHAIPEFEKSLAADKSIGAYYNLGFCHERLQHRQEAYDTYRQAQNLASVKKDERLREISGALAGLLETPHIRLVLPSPLPQGFQVRVDGDLISEAVYQNETLIFTKPGKVHEVLVTAPGYVERRENVENKQVRAIELRKPSDPTPAVSTDSGGWSWQRWGGLGLVVVGATLSSVAIGLFAAYNAKESKLRDQYEKACSENPCETPDKKASKDGIYADYEANERYAEKAAPVWIGLGAGGVLAIGTGVFLFLTAPSGSQAAEAPKQGRGRVRPVPMLGRVNGLMLEGSF